MWGERAERAGRPAWLSFWPMENCSRPAESLCLSHTPALASLSLGPRLGARRPKEGVLGRLRRLLSKAELPLRQERSRRLLSAEDRFRPGERWRRGRSVAERPGRVRPQAWPGFLSWMETLTVRCGGGFPLLAEKDTALSTDLSSLGLV